MNTRSIEEPNLMALRSPSPLLPLTSPGSRPNLSTPGKRDLWTEGKPSKKRREEGQISLKHLSPSPHSLNPADHPHWKFDVLDRDLPKCPMTAKRYQVTAEYDIPVWFEPISVAKSIRNTSVVDCITCASSNENELIAMTNTLTYEEEVFSIKQSTTKQKELSAEHKLLMLKPAIRVLLEKGIRFLMVTLGSDGIFFYFSEGLQLINNLLEKNIYSSSNKLHKLINEICSSRLYTGCMKSDPSSSCYYAFYFPAILASVVSIIGACNCLVGGFFASICSGLDIL